MGYALGIDIGGTACKGGLVAADGTLSSRSEISTRPGDGTGTVLELAETLLAKAREESVEIGAIGVGAAGFVDRRDGSISFSPNVTYENPQLAGALRDRFSLDTIVANDANAAAWGEREAGAAAGFDHVALVTLGTGVGGGFIIGGRLLLGATGAAAEFGHTVLDPEGPPCPCGLSGCVEQFVSGSAIARMGEQALARWPDSSIKDLAKGEPISALHVAQAAREWDEAAREVLARAGGYLGIALSNIVNMFEPEVIVIGGSVADAGESFLGPARDRFNAMLAQQHRRPVRLERARLGNDAGMVGAALLALGGPEAWQG